MAKPMLVSLPVLMLILDVWPLRRSLGLRARIVEKLPFALLAAASCVVTIVAQSGGGATRSLTMYPLASRIGNALVTYVIYLVDAVWPAGLAVFYPYPYAGIPAWKVAGAALVLAGRPSSAGARAPRAPPLRWLWYPLPSCRDRPQ
jgi:hypothetical protein